MSEVNSEYWETAEAVDHVIHKIGVGSLPVNEVSR